MVFESSIIYVFSNCHKGFKTPVSLCNPRLLVRSFVLLGYLLIKKSPCNVMQEIWKVPKEKIKKNVSNLFKRDAGFYLESDPTFLILTRNSFRAFFVTRTFLLWQGFFSKWPEYFICHKTFLFANLSASISLTRFLFRVTLLFWDTVFTKTVSWTQIKMSAHK